MVSAAGLSSTQLNYKRDHFTSRKRGKQKVEKKNPARKKGKPKDEAL